MKNEVMKQRFQEVSSGLIRRVDFDRWPSSIFFFKGEKWMFEYDIISGYLYCRYREVWEYLSSSNNTKYGDTQLFIKNVVEEHFKGKEVTPRFRISIFFSQVEEHFKGKDVTPTYGKPGGSLLVEEHFTQNNSEQIGSLFDLMPIGCFYNQNELPHQKDIPALWFSNGEAYFYYRGVYIRHELMYKLQKNSITFEEWAKEENEEVKSAIIAYLEEVHGGESAYRLISSHLKEVDTYVDKKDDKFLEGTTRGMNIGVYTLFKGCIDGVSLEDEDFIELAYIRCYCPSTDRMFFLGVAPKYTNAKDAIASLYKVPEKLSPHIKYINRQGERFSTILTDEGKKIRKEMTPEEWSDLTSITGEEYFSLMRYEY